MGNFRYLGLFETLNRKSESDVSTMILIKENHIVTNNDE